MFDFWSTSFDLVKAVSYFTRSSLNTNLAFQIHTDKGNGTKMSMPSSALATKDNNGTMCSKDVKKEQKLILSWKEPQKNDTRFTLERFVHVSFLRMPNSSL